MCPVELPLQLDHLGRVVGSGTGRIGDRDGQKQLYAIMFYPSMRIFYHRFFRRRRFLTAAGAFVHIESVPESGAQSIGLWNPPPETLDTATPENRNSDRPRRCGTAGIAKPDLRRRRLPTMRSIPQQSTSCDLAHYFPEPPPTPAPRQIDARRRPHAKHTQSRSITASNRCSVPASKPRLTSIRCPLGSQTAKPLLLSPPVAAVALETSTASQPFPSAASPAICRCRLR